MFPSPMKYDMLSEGTFFFKSSVHFDVILSSGRKQNELQAL